MHEQKRIKNELNCINVPVLDHVVVEQYTVSFAARGLLQTGTAGRLGVASFTLLVLYASAFLFSLFATGCERRASSPV